MKLLRKFLGIVFLFILTAMGAYIYMGYETYKEEIENIPLDEAVIALRSGDNYTYLSEVPQIYLDAVVAVEDRRFYHHNGIDPIGIFRAMISNIKQKELAEGGRTISQQLVKNIYIIADDCPIRKIAELFITLNLEKEYAKDEILEMYINGIYYGSGYYNIYDASMGYFGKEPIMMTDYEATLLAGIPNAPSVYSPKNKNGLAEKRQEKVLDSMVEYGYISKKEKNKILEERQEIVH